ncbi:MAG: hypothetical protein RSA79_07795, partial [Oscillospiraceae bacterium]
MKICPKCQANNSDKNKQCVECQSFIGNVEISIEKDFMKNVMKREKTSRIRKRIIIATAIALYYICYNIWSASCCYKMFGNIDNYLKLLPLYLPCILIFFFPYDKLYCYIRKKMKKPQKHISDVFVTGYIAVGVLYLA